jgi:hypothetical protein
MCPIYPNIRIGETQENRRFFNLRRCKKSMKKVSGKVYLFRKKGRCFCGRGAFIIYFRKYFAVLWDRAKIKLKNFARGFSWPLGGRQDAAPTVMWMACLFEGGFRAAGCRPYGNVDGAFVRRWVPGGRMPPLR